MTITLPVPPSVNNLFNNRKGGRYKTAAYEEWIELSGWELLGQRARSVRGTAVAVEIYLPWKLRGDIDNRAKPVLDLLVKHGIIDDDRKVDRLVIERDTRLTDRCLVEVRASARKAAA
jgi:crossover junction endodeoxyribonuclease RusA